MIRLLFVLAALALVLTACEDEDSAPDAPATPTGTSSGMDVEQTPGHIDDFAPEVQALADRAANEGFTGSYTLRANVFGTSVSGDATWYEKDGRVRADFAGKIGDQNTNVQVFPGTATADLSLQICDGAACSQWSPVLTPESMPDNAIPAIVTSQVLQVTQLIQGLGFDDKSARTIAGEDTTCYTGRTEVPGSSIDHGQVCLSEDGLPLLVTAAGVERTISLTATKIQRSVDDGVFAVPGA